MIRLRGTVNKIAKDAVDEAYREASLRPGEVLLDFSEVDYINSTGIAVIVGLLAMARAEQRQVGARVLDLVESGVDGLQVEQSLLLLVQLRLTGFERLGQFQLHAGNSGAVLQRDLRRRLGQAVEDLQHLLRGIRGQAVEQLAGVGQPSLTSERADLQLRGRGDQRRPRRIGSRRGIE